MNTFLEELQKIPPFIWIILILSILYIIGLINGYKYTKYVYMQDVNKLKDEEKRKLGGMSVQNTRNGITRYAPKIAEGNLEGIKKEYTQKLEESSKKYKHDQVNNIISIFRNIFSIFK